MELFFHPFALAALALLTLVCLWMCYRYLRVRKQLRERGKLLHDMHEQRTAMLRMASLVKMGLSSKQRSDFGTAEPKLDLAIYGSAEGSDWELLYNALNRLSDGFLDRLKQQYYERNEQEFKLCCLIYAQFDNTDASAMLSIENKTVRNLRSSIHKRLAIPKGTDIYDFLHRLSQKKNASC